MKIAEIMPLYKSKARDSLTNYRSISLLPTTSKLLEKIIYKRLYSFLKKHSIIKKSIQVQKGTFMPITITELVGEILKSREQKKQTLSF